MPRLIKPKTKFPSKAVMKERLRIFNPHGIMEFSPDRLYIGHTPQTTGRGSMPACFRVYKEGVPTNPKGHWLDYGNKTFIIHRREEIAETLAAAIAWTDKKFGKRTWVRDPFGSYQDARALAAVWEALQKAESNG